jgi:cell division protein ZapA
MAAAHSYDFERSTHGITVEIYDQTYRLLGEDPAYMGELAALVDSKMRAVAGAGATVDSLRVAVLAALNIADQLLAVQDKYRTLSGSVHQAHQVEDQLQRRASRLTGLLDSILTEN